MPLKDLRVGLRVADSEGNYGTVRYIGPVAASKVKTDEWIGVEWDDPTRGKHDGSCLDESGVFHRYFECAFGAGSFVKEHKLLLGRSFLEALYERYQDTSEASEAGDNYALTARGNQKPIEFVGEEVIRRWQRLEVISKVTLPRLNIAFAGENIEPIAGHFQHVDIQNNLMSSWMEVARIAVQIPSLESYYILGNRMETVTPEVVVSLPPGCFAHIKTFCISKCRVPSWESVLLLQPLLPALEDLFMTHSRLFDLPSYDPQENPMTVTGFSRLQRIDLSNCELSSWGQILSLGSLPELREVLADDNPISRITPCPPDFFKNLSRFSLSGIQIEAWSDIDCFSTYTALRNLRVSEIPFLVNKGISESRANVIARLGQITFLNGSPITEKERSNAENTYVRRCLRDFECDSDIAVERIIDSGLHPRFAELHRRYSSDLVALSKNKGSSALQNDIVEVTLRNQTFIGSGSLEPVCKKIPSSLQVARLRQIVKQLFHIEPILQRISVRVYKDAMPVLMEDDDLTLAQYGVVNGAEIFINEDKAY